MKGTGFASVLFFFFKKILTAFTCRHCYLCVGKRSAMGIICFEVVRDSDCGELYHGVLASCYSSLWSRNISFFGTGILMFR